jgi:epoxyqueuosine reductase
VSGDPQRLTTAIVDQGLELGATAAGIASRPTGDTPRGALVTWPRGAEALVVLTLAHPEDEPDLDYWGVRGSTIGNRRQKRMLDDLAAWLRAEHGIDAQPLPYQIEQGGTFLKDAAALAGLGVVGVNNLLITPDHGPRVRLRALAVATPLATTEPRDFAPCAECARPCLAACPQDAFESGKYDRRRCQRQMTLDEAARAVRSCNGSPRSVIAYCRACELGCVVGESP